MLRVVGTCKNPLNIVNCQIKLVLAAMEKNWSVFPVKFVFFHIVWLVKLVSIFEFSLVLAAVEMQ